MSKEPEFRVHDLKFTLFILPSIYLKIKIIKIQIVQHKKAHLIKYVCFRTFLKNCHNIEIEKFALMFFFSF